MKDPELETYCQRIESHFFQWKGRPGMLAPEDFARVKQWYEEGLRLEAVLEGISEAFRSHQAGRNAEFEQINSLAFCEAFVRAAGERSKY
jgi:hypothetical protein